MSDGPAKPKLLIKEIVDLHVQENFTRLQAFIAELSVGDTTNQITQQTINLDSDLTMVEADVAELILNQDDLVVLTGVAENSTDLGTFPGTLFSDSATIKAILIEAETQLETNITNISTNTGNIAGNVIDIATNASGIATNVTNVGINAGNIATNVTNIGTNVTNIATNVTDIGTNATNIATNVTDIATNVTDIGTNLTAIGVNAGGIATNVTDIGTNLTAIGVNAADIATNVTDIGTNVTNIGTNVTDIATNVTDIGTNVTNIGINAAAIVSNGINISLNAAGVAANVIAIAASDANIAELTLNQDDLITLTGIPENQIHLGVFTGSLTNATTIKVCLQELGTLVDTNIANIATNVTDIGTNVTNIAANLVLINTNITDIAANLVLINTNITDIGTNTTNIGTNTSGIAELVLNQDDLVTLTGVAENVTNLGTFTGVTITDNVVIKVALQDLETQLDTNTTALGTATSDISELELNQDDLITLTGVAENVTNLGTFTGVTITDNVVIKVALQELETQVEVNITNIGTNVTNIGTNTTNIGTNVTNIGTNTSGIAELVLNQDDLITLTGVAENVTNLGTFTGTTITDSVVIKVALQELETKAELNTTNITANDVELTELTLNQDDLVTLTGVAENNTDLGTFTGTTITDSVVIKVALQELETKAELNTTNVTSNDVELTELTLNQDDLVTLTGVAENNTDLGVFTGATITDSVDIKASLQSLETAYESAVFVPNNRIPYGNTAGNGLDSASGVFLTDSVVAESSFTIGTSRVGGLHELPLNGATFGHKDAFPTNMAFFQTSSGQTYVNGADLAGLNLVTGFNTANPQVNILPSAVTLGKGVIFLMKGTTSGIVTFAVTATTASYLFAYPDTAPANDEVMTFQATGLSTFAKLTNSNLNLGLTASRAVITDSSGDLASNTALTEKTFTYWDDTTDQFQSATNLVYNTTKLEYNFNAGESSKASVVIKANIDSKTCLNLEVDMTTTPGHIAFAKFWDTSREMGSITSDGYYLADGVQTSTKETPAFTFHKDTDTGMYQDSVDLLQFSAGGIEHLSMTGNVVKTERLRAESIGTQASSFNFGIDTAEIADATSAAVIGTLPVLSGVTEGTIYRLKKVDVSANTVTLKGNGAETIDGANTVVLATQYDYVSVIKEGTDWWIIG